MGKVPNQVHQNSMQSTWRQTRKNWKPENYAMEFAGLQPTNMDEPVPVHKKTDKMGYLPEWDAHVWVLFHAIWPIVGQQLFCWIFGANFNAAFAFLYYTFAFHVNAIHQLFAMRRFSHMCGFLDGDKHERDQVPDGSAQSVMSALTFTATFRPMMAVMLAYRASRQPIHMSLFWAPFEIGVYGLVLDFWFYWYHRVMHEYDGLWKYHRTHHLTKHPTPLLTLFADTEQELFDVAVVPLMTYVTMKLMGFPMGFYELWLCHQYIVFTELWGHSGIRLWVTPPSTNSWFLNLIGAELTTEDHDLHHRQGWRHSANYGKQTRFWDKLFGTCGKRIELVEDVVDFNDPVYLQWLPGWQR